MNIMLINLQHHTVDMLVSADWTEIESYSKSLDFYIISKRISFLDSLPKSINNVGGGGGIVLSSWKLFFKVHI